MTISRRSIFAVLSLFAIGFSFASAAPKDAATEKGSCKAACLACAEACKKCIEAHKDQADCCSLCEVCSNMCLASAAAEGKEVESLVRTTCEQVCRKCLVHCKSMDDDIAKACAKACAACADACKASVAKAK